MSNDKLKIIPLGGLGEIGRNMMLYEYDGHILVVDCGLMFPDNDMLGVDYIIPDIQYLVQNRDQVDGIIITHGHEDHIGAVHHLLEQVNAPIYATPLTCGLLEVRLARHNMLQRAVLNRVQAGSSVPIGPFNVEFFHVSHSIPDCVGLGIDTPAGLVVHSGDYKFDQTPVDNWPSDFSKLAEFSRRGTLALLADSTNAEHPGWTPSERVVDGAFEKVFSEAQGRIIIASFASLISRMQQVANAAARHGRKLAFAGPSMLENLKITRKLGYLNIPDSQLVSIEQALSMPPRDIAIMCTGSQGEPTSILGRLSTGTNRQFDLRSGDTVVLSSQPIPGNEENIYRTINRLFQRGANVIYEAIAPVHVSGHASQEEIKMLLNIVRPKYFIPMHGELRHLRQSALLAQQVGIPPENISVIENGQVVEFIGGEMRLNGRVACAYVFVDGAGVGDVSLDVMREREILAEDGVVMASITVDTAGELAVDPQVVSYGFTGAQDAGDLLARAAERAAESVWEAAGKDLNKEVELALRAFFYSETRRRPRVFVSVQKLSWLNPTARGS